MVNTHMRLLHPTAGALLDLSSEEMPSCPTLSSPDAVLLTGVISTLLPLRRLRAEHQEQHNSRQRGQGHDAPHKATDDYAQVG